MRKFFVALLAPAVAVLFLAPSTVAAQSLQLGVKAGLNSANVSVTDPNEAISPDSRRGILAGAFVRGGRPDSPISLQLEALLTQKGFNITKNSCSSGCAAVMARITYLEIPVLARYSFQTSGDAHPYVAIGPTLALKMSTGYKPPLTPGDPEVINGHDLGFSLGGGADYGKLVFDARYTAGLSSILTKEAAANPRQAATTAKNRTLSISVGYRLGQ